MFPEQRLGRLRRSAGIRRMLDLDLEPIVDSGIGCDSMNIAPNFVAKICSKIPFSLERVVTRLLTSATVRGINLMHEYNTCS